MSHPGFAAVVAAVALAGPAVAQTPAAPRAFVKTIEVNSPAGATDLFQAVFRERVAAKLAKCAAGTYPTTLRVEISKYRRADPAFRDMVSPSSLLKATVQLIDPAAGKVLTTHELKTTTGGGIDQAYRFITLAEVEAAMASDFGDEICKRMFTGG